MAHDPHHPHDPEHAAEHHGVGHEVSPKILIATASALLVLTVITVAVASVDFGQVDLSELNVFVALGIAVIKASLVCLFFMHLRWDRPFNSFVLVGSLALVGLFISFAITDTTEYKGEVLPGESTIIQAKLADVDKAIAAGHPPPAEGTAPGDEHAQPAEPANSGTPAPSH